MSKIGPVHYNESTIWIPYVALYNMCNLHVFSVGSRLQSSRQGIRKHATGLQVQQTFVGQVLPNSSWPLSAGVADVVLQRLVAC